MSKVSSESARQTDECGDPQIDRGTQRSQEPSKAEGAQLPGKRLHQAPNAEEGTQDAGRHPIMYMSEQLDKQNSVSTRTQSVEGKSSTRTTAKYIVDENDDFYLKKEGKYWALENKQTRLKTHLMTFRNAKAVHFEGPLLEVDGIPYDIIADSKRNGHVKLVAIVDVEVEGLDQSLNFNWSVNSTSYADTSQDATNITSILPAQSLSTSSPPKNLATKCNTDMVVEEIFPKKGCEEVTYTECTKEFEKPARQTTRPVRVPEESNILTTKEGINVRVYKAIICNVNVDCIVNAANGKLSHGAGVSLAIAREAGRKLTEEGNDFVRRYGSIKTGQVCSTSGGNLPYGHVIHAIGPRWSEYDTSSLKGVSSCADDLHQAVLKSFQEAERLGYKSVALPAISSAIFGVPIDLCVIKYADAVAEYSRQNGAKGGLDEIHFVDINQDMVDAIWNYFETVFVQNKPCPYNISTFVRESKNTSGSINPRKKYQY